MESNWLIEKSDRKKRDNIYYLIRDILSCFPNNFENHFLSIFNHNITSEV